MNHAKRLRPHEMSHAPTRTSMVGSLEWAKSILHPSRPAHDVQPHAHVAPTRQGNAPPPPSARDGTDAIHEELRSGLTDIALHSLYTQAMTKEASLFDAARDNTLPARNQYKHIHGAECITVLAEPDSVQEQSALPEDLRWHYMQRQTVPWDGANQGHENARTKTIQTSAKRDKFASPRVFNESDILQQVSLKSTANETRKAICQTGDALTVAQHSPRQHAKRLSDKGELPQARANEALHSRCPDLFDAHGEDPDTKMYNIAREDPLGIGSQQAYNQLPEYAQTKQQVADEHLRRKFERNVLARQLQRNRALVDEQDNTRFDWSEWKHGAAEALKRYPDVAPDQVSERMHAMWRTTTEQRGTTDLPYYPAFWEGDERKAPNTSKQEQATAFTG